MLRKLEPIPFPLPSFIGGRKKWRFGKLREYEARMENAPEPEIDPADDFWVGASFVKERYGVTDMWLHRHAKRNEEEYEDSGAPLATERKSL